MIELASRLLRPDEIAGDKQHAGFGGGFRPHAARRGRGEEKVESRPSRWEKGERREPFKLQAACWLFHNLYSQLSPICSLFLACGQEFGASALRLNTNRNLCQNMWRKRSKPIGSTFRCYCKRQDPQTRKQRWIGGDCGRLQSYQGQ